MKAPLWGYGIPRELWPALALPLNVWPYKGLDRGVTCYKAEKESRSESSSPEEPVIGHRDAFEVLDSIDYLSLGFEESLVLHGLWRLVVGDYSENVDPLCSGLNPREDCGNPVFARSRNGLFGLWRTGLLWAVVEYLRVLHYPVPRELLSGLKDPESIVPTSYCFKDELDSESLCRLHGYVPGEGCEEEIERGVRLARSLDLARRRFEPGLLRSLALLLMEMLPEATLFPPRGSLLFRAMASLPAACREKTVFWYRGANGLEFTDASVLEGAVYNGDLDFIGHGYGPLVIARCEKPGTGEIMVFDYDLGLTAWWPDTPGGIESAKSLVTRLFLSTCIWSLRAYLPVSLDDDYSSPQEILGLKEEASAREILESIDKGLLKPPVGSWSKLLPSLLAHAEIEELSKPESTPRVGEPVNLAKRILRKVKAPRYCLSVLEYLEAYRDIIPGLEGIILEECGILMDAGGELVKSTIENCRDIAGLLLGLKIWRI